MGLFRRQGAVHYAVVNASDVHTYGQQPAFGQAIPQVIPANVVPQPPQATSTK